MYDGRIKKYQDWFYIYKTTAHINSPFHVLGSNRFLMSHTSSSNFSLDGSILETSFFFVGEGDSEQLFRCILADCFDVLKSYTFQVEFGFWRVKSARVKIWGICWSLDLGLLFFTQNCCTTHCWNLWCSKHCYKWRSKLVRDKVQGQSTRQIHSLFCVLLQ